jgi:chorismate dehydratase
VLPSLKEYHIISGYGIACDGAVASVCLFSDVPLPQVDSILLDYQSKTSVSLLKLLLKEHWNISPKLLAGKNGYEAEIGGNVAGLVIGDRALNQRKKSAFTYDLGLAWQELTGLPFVFAAWVSNKELPVSFCNSFNETTRTGLDHIQEIVAANRFDSFNLEEYYNNFIKFSIDIRMQEGLTLFLNKQKNGL